MSEITITSSYSDRVVAATSGQSLSPEVLFITAVESLPVCPLFESPLGSEESISRRVIVEFPNGWIFTVPIDQKAFLFQVDEKHSVPKKELEYAVARISNCNLCAGHGTHSRVNGENIEFEDCTCNPLGIILDFDGSVSWHKDLPKSISSRKWEWNPGAFAWETNSAALDDLVAIFLDLKMELGEPKILLPWENFSQKYLDDPEGVDLEFYEDEPEILAASVEFVNACGGWESPSKFNPELVQIVPGDTLLSKNSGYWRFFSMLDKLESEHNWIVLDNECCGTCANGSLRDIRESDPTKANSPSFIVWEQNPESYFFANGAISVEHYPDNADAELPILGKVANEFGLEVVGNDPVVITVSDSVEKMNVTRQQKEIQLEDLPKISVNTKLASELVIQGLVKISSGNLTEAEELLVSAHENASTAAQRDGATLSIIEKILIPQSRLVEAMMWTRSVVNIERRKNIRSQISNLLALPTEFVRATEQENWKDADLTLPMQKSADQQYFYNRFVSYLNTLPAEDLSRDTLSTWPGPSFYGFIIGIWDQNPDLAKLGCHRETITWAVLDFVNYVMELPLGSEERDPAIAESPYLDYAEAELLALCDKNDPWALKQYGVRLHRIGDLPNAVKYWQQAAALGNNAALRNLGITALQENKVDEAIDFFKQAIATGSRTAHHALADAYEMSNPDLVEATLVAGVEHLDVQAMNRLGILKGKQRDRVNAIKYYRMAAEYGNYVAMANLAGLLFTDDPIQALIWLERAEQEDNPVSRERIRDLRNLLNYMTEQAVGEQADDEEYLDDFDDDDYDDDDDD